MRIVDRDTFLALPSGTVFAKFFPHYLDEVAIKGETVGSDYVVQELGPWFEGDTGSESWAATILEMMAGKPSPPLDYDCAGRDGLFDRDQLFAVWSPDDTRALIARLQAALREVEEAPAQPKP